MYLQQRLYLFKMTEGTNLSQHDNQFNQISVNMGLVSVTIEDEDNAMLLLYSLTPEYETLVNALQANKEIKTLQYVTDSLLGHHNRHQKHSVGGNAHEDGMYANTSQSKRNNEKQGDSKKKKVVYYKCQEI